MPALSGPQLALLRAQAQTSNWFAIPIPPVTVFAAQINSASITVGVVTIPYDNVTTGAFGAVLKGMTVLVGSAPGLSDYGVLRERLNADASNLYVAWNSDIAWADNLYLTVYQQFLAWSVRQRIVPPTIYKDYNIPYTDQTEQWPPIALMGDNVCKLFAGNPTPVSFPISGVPVAVGATIASYAINFGDGGTSTSSGTVTHNYTAAGTYYATLTVTDSNGKTHLTRRIVCLADPATLYTVNFESTSLEAQVDDGWKARVRVFDANADTSHFPDRAPCFLISTDSYGGTVGSVGFPTGREDVVFFGYIVQDSVAVQPEYNDATFELESIAGAMSRADSPPVYLGDSNSPSGEPDAWAWGEDLNVFRGLVYLLKFHSTVMDIADVSLYNDTTLTKAVDYPADSLWNMLLQFAKGKRLLRASVTRTGRVVVGRDPNLTPIASRSAYATVCTLAQGDWREQVTLPQVPYPNTSFLCLSGLSYDGDPSHEPNPLFGMSPGRPPKDYGSERELQYLKLVDQTEANTLAGLLVGTDNTPYGDIVIPLRGNWVKAFEPALQEYVQTPAGGWVTKRGTLLDSVKLIVRKLTVAFDWEHGTMMPTLTCEYPSVPEIGVNGDCFPPDAPPPPAQNIPPIVPPLPAPVPTGSTGTFSRGVWTLMSSGDIYKLTSAASGGGSATSKTVWGAGLGATLYGEGLAPASGNALAIVADAGNTVWLARSTDDGASWAATDTTLEGAGFEVQSDAENRNVLRALSAPLENASDDAALAASTGLTSGPYTVVFAINNLTTWHADTKPLYLWCSTNDGAAWTPVLLDYIGQTYPIRMYLQGVISATRHFYVIAYPGDEPLACDGHIAGVWSNVSVDNALPNYDTHNYIVCDASKLRDSTNLVFRYPSLGLCVAPAHGDAFAYILVGGLYIDTTVIDTVDQFGTHTTWTPGLAVSPVQGFDSNAYIPTFVNLIASYVYKVTTGLASSSQLFVNYNLGVGCAKRSDTNILYALNDPLVAGSVLGNYHELATIDWGGTSISAASIGISASETAMGLLCTTQDTLLVVVSSSPDSYILRSTNGGASWTTISPAALVGIALVWNNGIHLTEYGGTVGGGVGVVVWYLNGEGKYLYSLDDGLTWALTAVLTSLGNANATSAR